jgi:DNA-binding XRE family transcriptional regulator
MTKDIELKGYENLKLLKQTDKQQEFIEFCRWFSSVDKKPKTQRGLALKLGLSEQTLVNWKEKEAFGYNVRYLIKQQLGSDLMPHISKALRDNIIKKQDVKSIEIVLKWLNEYEDIAMNIDKAVMFTWQQADKGLTEPIHKDIVDST